MVLRKDIKTIIFDLDGTLHDLDIDWTAVKRNLGVSQEENLQDFIERADEAGKGAIYHELEKAELVGFGKGFSKEIITQLETLTPDFKLIIFSRNSESVIKRFIAKASPMLMDQVLVVGRKNGSAVKPDVTSLTERHRVGSDSVMVGDTSHDVEVAKRLGIKCIIIHNKKNQYTPSGADTYVDSLMAAIGEITGK